MRKKGKKWFGLLIAIVFLCAFCVPVAAASKLPRLQVKGTQLVNSSGKKVQLRGISTHGLSWYPEYVNQSAFTFMKKNWKVNAVRLAMYTAEYNGYCTGDASNRRKLEACIDNGVKYATNAGMYVIIDWHILSDGNPQQNQKEALKFFKKMAKKYKNNIYFLDYLFLSILINLVLIFFPSVPFSLPHPTPASHFDPSNLVTIILPFFILTLATSDIVFCGIYS